ncbi:hypothetical protein TrVFT333_007447 [Trichoderma virens FT-333]|nr:hypothetical protein TrVFT333_007447 [Trichoderma virens FT-333]
MQTSQQSTNSGFGWSAAFRLRGSPTFACSRAGFGCLRRLLSQGISRTGTCNPPPRDYGTLWRLPERIMARRPQEKDAASKLEVLGWLKRQAQNQKVPQHYASHAVAAKPLAACPPAATGPPKLPTQVIRVFQS